MSWEDFALARKTLLEEHVGSLVREAKRVEDKAARKTRATGSRMNSGR